MVQLVLKVMSGALGRPLERMEGNVRTALGPLGRGPGGATMPAGPGRGGEGGAIIILLSPLKAAHGIRHELSKAERKGD